MAAASSYFLRYASMKCSPRSFQCHYTKSDPRALKCNQIRNSSGISSSSSDSSSITSNDIKNCWKCGTQLTCNETLFCEEHSCGVVQSKAAADVNFFSLFGIEKNVVHNLDVKLVERRFKDLQKLLHPDKFTLKSAEEQEASAITSSMVNQAYQTIINPQLRLSYTLKSLGINVLSEEGGSYENATLMVSRTKFSATTSLSYLACFLSHFFSFSL